MSQSQLTNLLLRAAGLCLLLVLTGLSAGSNAAAQAQTFDMGSFARAAVNNAVGRQNLVQYQIQAANQMTQRALRQNLPLTSTGVQSLPVVSTGSVNINTVDLPFIRSNGGGGAFPSAGGAPGSSGGGGSPGGNQGMPDLPPGYVGVQNSHDGSFMGAVPPGGNIVDFFRGVYGLQPGEEAEANYILHNQLQEAWQSGMFEGLWGQYQQSGPPP